MGKSTNFLLGELSAQTNEIIKALNNESDIGAVLIATSFLDACLATLLRKAFRKGTTTENLLDPGRGILGTFSSKCDMAYCMELITKDSYNELVILGQIRNRFAHNHLETKFKNDNISPLCQKLKFPEKFLEAHKDANNLEELEKYMQHPRSRFATSVSQLSRLLILEGMSLQWHGYEKSCI